MQRDAFEVEHYPSLERFQSQFRDRTINVLIATEEIIGPVRNGGIASTYYHLARGLARQGHKVTVLYLKGHKVENETPEHWVEHYAKFGIEMVFLDFVEQPLVASSERWQRTYYSFYLWLKQNDRFDVIHTSEWRGGAFYCLQAKRLGLAFQDSFFIVKTSSPHIWNRHYQMQPIEEPDMMSGSFAEQKCVEWADMVVGGSAHLLSFMKHIGYTIPADRTYVQPNIIDFSEVIVTDQRAEREFGETIHTQEIVFFGRLEPRKGLDLFVNAMNLLVSRGIRPSRVNFLGKEGERLSNYGGVKPLDFIATNAKNWPFETEVITDKNQPEALSFMCQRDMLAIMPSLIENSTMAVYEALVHKIPFIATAVGGTPELVGDDFRKRCLISPSAEELADRIQGALKNGHCIATPAFDNEKNLETWYAFHRFVAEHGTRALVAPDAVPAAATDNTALPISYFAYVSDSASLTRQVQNMRSSSGFEQMLIGAAFPVLPEQRAALEANAPEGLRIVECVGLSAGEAFNRFRRQASGEILVFDAVCGLRFEPRFAEDVRCALRARPGSICTTAVRFRDDPNDPSVSEKNEVLLLPIGDIAAQYATGCAYGLEIIALRVGTAQRIGSFEPYHLSSGIVHEYVSRAVLSGVEFQVITETGVYFEGASRPWESPTPNYEYMKSKSLIDSVSLPLKKILLYNLGQGKERFRRAAARKFVANAGRGQQEVAWLVNANAAVRNQPEALSAGGMLLGLDTVLSRLSVGLPGWGYLRVTVNGENLMDRDDVGSHLKITVITFDILPLFEKGDRLWLKIEFNGDGRTQVRTLALQKFEDNIHFISAGRHRILWGGEFEAAVTTLQARVSARAELRVKHAPPPVSEAKIEMLVIQARKLMAEFGITAVTPGRSSTSVRERRRHVTGNGREMTVAIEPGGERHSARGGSYVSLS
jgi:glycosyltransferase involved in cell wall biosynthesis